MSGAAGQNTGRVGRQVAPGPLWQPGRSPNPGGRPKAVRAVVEAARAHTPEAIATLAEIMNNREEKGVARVMAAREILDRGWGKAPQEMRHTGSVNVVRDMTNDQLDAALARAMAVLDGTVTVEAEPGGQD